MAVIRGLIVGVLVFAGLTLVGGFGIGVVELVLWLVVAVASGVAVTRSLGGGEPSQ